MKKSTKQSLLIWGGSLAALVLMVWGLTVLSGSYNSGTFSATPLDLTSAADFEHVRGPVDAPVTIVEYSDFQCPFCQQAAPIVDRLLAEYPEHVRVIYRHFPLRQVHAQAQLAAEVAEAAGRQGAFWEMHDILFANQSTWAANLGARGIFETYAEALELDVEQFQKDLKDRALGEKIDHDYASGVKAGVQGTPSFFVNGVRLQTPGYAGFTEMIDAIVASPSGDDTVEDDAASEEPAE